MKRKNILIYLIMIGLMVFLASCQKHKHAFEENWSFDEMEHYHQAICEHKDEKTDRELHSYSDWESYIEDDKKISERACIICSYVERKEEPLPNHVCNFGYWSIDKKPTFSETGSISRVCKEDQSHIENKTLPILNKVDYVYRLVKEATCSENGKETYSYTAEIVITIDLPTLEHPFNTTYDYDKDSHWFSASCEHKDEKKDIEKHQFGNWRMKEQPSYDKTGEKERECQICHYVDRIVFPILNETDYDYTLLKAPTCLEDGKARYVYNNVDTFEVVLNKIGHSFAEEYSFDQYNHYYAATCEHKDEKKDVEKHQWNDWETVLEATESENGLKIRKCNSCSYYEEATIPSKEHTHQYGEWTVTLNPSFQHPGELSRVCLKDSSHIERRELPILNEDDYQYTLVKEASCLEDGLSTYLFENKYLISIILKQTGHSYSKEWSSDAQNHFHVAICEHRNEKSDIEEHLFEKNICSICNYARYTQGLAYELNEEGTGYYVVGIGEATDEDIIIPSTHDNLPVIRINNQAFASNGTIKSVRLTENLIELGEYAFWDCPNLTDLYLGNSSIKMEAGAFYDCVGLTNIENSHCIVSLGNYSFYNCKLLNNLDLRNASSLGTGALWNCYALERVELNDSLTELANYLFYNCINLKELMIPNSVTMIGTDVFRGVEGLEKLTMPMNLVADISFYSCKNIILTSGTELPNDAFRGYTMLETVTLPETLISIGEGAFDGCSNLRSISFPNSTTTIGDLAFYDCVNLTSITLPNNLVSIGTSTFKNCYRLLEVYNLTELDITDLFSVDTVIHTSVLEPSQIMVTEDGYCFYKNNGNNYLIAYYGTDAEIILPEHIFNESYDIYPNAFRDNLIIQSVSLSDLIKSIGAYSFYGCNNLENIYLSENLLEIGEEAFSGCDNLNYNQYDNGLYLGSLNNPFLFLKSVQDVTADTFIIASDTRLVERRALFGMENLKELTLPALRYSLKEDIIGRMLSSLTQIKIVGKNDTLYSILLNELYNLTEVTLPNTIKRIEENTFRMCQTKAVYYEGSIEDWCRISLGNYASNPKSNTNTKLYFKGDNGAYEEPTSITLSDSIHSIGNYQFYQWNTLETISLPNSLEHIGEYAFEYCDNLVLNEFDNGLYIGNTSNPYLYLVKAKNTTISSILILKETRFIDSNAFERCRMLKSIYYEGTIEEWDEMNKNLMLSNDIIFIYSEIEPTEDGNYWHYVDGVPTKWTI